jgi:5'-nucleotidase (lipoprotein e(P4) family)
MSGKKYLLSFGLILTSIVSTYFVTVSTTAQQGAKTQTVTADNEYQVGAILFMQKSAEYRALCYQAFNWAQTSLDMDDKTKKKLPKTERRKMRAVVVDIDETVLDNSPAQAVQVKNRLPFIQSNWTAWVMMRKAKAIPGAVDFLKYAWSKNVRVFYISNRIEVEKQATMDNLKALGFPDVTDETVLVKTTESSKKARRAVVTDKYRIALFLGDNLDDFSEIFERKSINDRFMEVDRARGEWGKRFIVLPNAMYGTWENAVYEYPKTALTEAQKSEKRANALETY